MIAPAALRDRALINWLNDRVNVYDKANMNPASFLPDEQPNLTPVLVEGSIYYNLATYREAASGSELGPAPLHVPAGRPVESLQHRPETPPDGRPIVRQWQQAGRMSSAGTDSERQ